MAISRRVTHSVLLAGALTAVAGAGFAAASIAASYFNFTTSSSGGASSPEFAPNNPMYLCADVQNSTKGNVLHAQLKRDLDFLPDPTQKALDTPYNDAYNCATSFYGTGGETYYTQAQWSSESPGHNGYVEIAKR